MCTPCCTLKHSLFAFRIIQHGSNIVPYSEPAVLCLNIGMEVIKNPFPGIIEPEKEKVNLIDLVHDRISKGENLTVRRTEPDPRKRNLMLGYYAPYGVAYMSSPENERAIFAIDAKNKTLVVDFNGGAVWGQRDAYVYRDVEGLEITPSFEELLAYFISNGYQIKKFNPKDASDYLILYKNAEEIPRAAEQLGIDAVKLEMPHPLQLP